MVILGNLLADVLYGVRRPADQVLRQAMDASDDALATGAGRAGPDRRSTRSTSIPVRTYWQLVRQRFLQHRLAVIALVIADRSLDRRWRSSCRR